MKRFIFILSIIAAQVQNSSAQEVFNNVQPGERRAYLSFEIDPTFAVVAGFARGFEIKAINRNLTVTADITLPIFLVDFKHYRIKIGSRVPLFDSKKWNIINRFSIKNKGTQNIIYSGNALSIEEGLLLGYFSKKWFAAGEVDYDKFILTHIEHSNWYRENVHPDAIDGWYGGTGGRIKIGLQSGYTFRNIIELALGLGMSRTESFNEPVGLPIFMSIAVNYHM